MWRDIALAAVAFGLGTSVGAIAFGQSGTDEPSKAVRIEAVVAPTVPAPTLEPLTVVLPSKSDRPLADEMVSAPPDMQQQFDEMSERWRGLADQVERLQTQVASLQSQFPGATALPEAFDQSVPIQLQVETQDPRIALLTAGVPDALVDDLVRREAQRDLDRLELQDRASREGWFRSDRYFEELEQLDDDDFDIRAEIGDASYDRYLYARGQVNRVRVSAVIPGSQAEQSGVLPGDVIERYNGRPVFGPGELRTATTGGVRDEFVAVQIRRGETQVDTWLQRGPLGVRISGARVEPSG